MINICFTRTSGSRYVPAVFRVVDLRAFHIAHDAAHVVRAGDVQAVVDSGTFRNHVSALIDHIFIADDGIDGVAYKAAHIATYGHGSVGFCPPRHCAKVIARAAEVAFFQITDEAAGVTDPPTLAIFRTGTGNGARIDEIFINGLLAVIPDTCTDNASNIGCTGDGGAVCDVGNVRAALYGTGERAYVILTGDAAAYEGDVIYDRTFPDHAEKTDVVGIPIDIQIENIVIQPVEFTGK